MRTGKATRDFTWINISQQGALLFRYPEPQEHAWAEPFKLTKINHFMGQYQGKDVPTLHFLLVNDEGEKFKLSLSQYTSKSFAILSALCSMENYEGLRFGAYLSEAGFVNAYVKKGEDKVEWKYEHPRGDDKIKDRNRLIDNMCTEMHTNLGYNPWEDAGDQTAVFQQEEEDLPF